MKSALKWDSLTIKRPGLTRNIPNGNEDLMWVANTSTLIYGDDEAILVDTFLTIEQNDKLIEWIKSHQKRLTAIYVTHAHGDHFFGLGQIRKHFPEVKLLGTAEVAASTKEQLLSPAIETFWKTLFPGQIPTELAAVEPVSGDVIELEGHELQIIRTGHTDIIDSTCLWVPSARLLLAGDVVYNGIHSYLGETTRESRMQWINTLRQLEQLGAEAVIVGHKVPEFPDDPAVIRKTREYLETFNTLENETHTAAELYSAMLERYPDYVNPGSLWGAVNKVKQ